MEKEIWTIDDIIKDYEDKGLVGRSKVDFLNSIKDFILKNTRYVQWSTISSEEHEKMIKEIKEKIKDKDFGSIDYTNPGLPINDIYIPKTKKYLKWEDLEFKPYTMKVKMGDNLYMLNWNYSNDDYNNSKSVTLRTLNGDWLFTLEKCFFNDLHLEVIE